MKETVLGQLDLHHQQEPMITSNALPPEEKAAMITEMTGYMADDGKKEEEGDEVAI